MDKKIGFIGLGVMGSAMAGNLAEAFPGILIFDVDSEKRNVLSSEKMIAVNSVEEIAEYCTVVFLSLPASAIVKEVVTGASGLAGKMKAGSFIIDTSTTEVQTVKEIAAFCKNINIEFIDSPVSGGEKAAKEGTLSFMVGCSECAFEEIKKYCETMAKSVVRVGESCMGQTAKAVNQMIVGATFAVIAESFSMGAKSGLDPKVLYEAIKDGWAGSVLLDVASKDMFSREFKPGGTIDIHWKDLGYAMSLSKETDVPVPVTAIVHEVFKAARAKGDGKKSQPAVIKLWESLLGLEVK